MLPSHQPPLLTLAPPDAGMHPDDAKKKAGVVFSFFSGAGFLDLGFEDEGFDPLLVNEVHEPFRRAYKHSRQVLGRPHPCLGYAEDSIEVFLRKSPRKWLRARVQEARATGLPVGFVGGPPCPDFSNAGKHAGKEGAHGRLTRVYINLICDQQPDFFVFENVRGLMQLHREHLREIETRLGKAGYRFSTQLLNALEYGVPQFRERVVIVGFHRRLFEESGKPVPWYYRLPEDIWQEHRLHDLGQLKMLPWPSAEPFEEGGEKPCPRGLPQELTVAHWFARNQVESHPNAALRSKPMQGLAKMQTIAEGDTTRKSFKRLHRWRYSATAAYGNLEVHLHPSQPRRLNVAEALALQSMPRAFELPTDMGLGDAFKTVGNGVPYLMARGIAKTVMGQLQALRTRASAAD